MNREELIELLKEHFPTKGEFLGSVKDIRTDIAELSETVTELKASSNTLDKILESHPIERITRLEDHVHLPNYVHVGSEE